MFVEFTLCCNEKIPIEQDNIEMLNCAKEFEH